MATAVEKCVIEELELLISPRVSFHELCGVEISLRFCRDILRIWYPPFLVDYDLVLCLWAILHCFRLQAAYDEMGWSKGAVTQVIKRLRCSSLH
jgi:hypothetical protein